ncbi:MAG: glycerol-3-phosphate responsive antiterminator [Clostridia bacterium]|nr:glycerol-3-phosphate responsive antiterminator [Clostridia bacterium]
MCVLDDSPMIAACKNDEGLERALASDCTVVYLLYGNICTIADLVQRIKDAGKMAFVHVDLIDGLSNRDIAVDFVKQNTTTDGIITTRPNLIRRGRDLGLITIQRFFLLDSMAFENVVRQSSQADVVEILPATMPKIIRNLVGRIRQPLVASGLIMDKEDIIGALSAGALAVSATNPDLWFL